MVVKYYTPTVIAGKMVNGELVENEKQEAVRQTVSEETSATMCEKCYIIRGEVFGQMERIRKGII